MGDGIVHLMHIHCATMCIYKWMVNICLAVRHLEAYPRACQDGIEVQTETRLIQIIRYYPLRLQCWVIIRKDKIFISDPGLVNIKKLIDPNHESL